MTCIDQEEQEETVFLVEKEVESNVLKFSELKKITPKLSFDSGNRKKVQH